VHHALGSDDLFLAFVRYAPFLFVVGGLLTVLWLSRDRSSSELQPDVLAALSETEALSAAELCRRPPLAGQSFDPEVLLHTLDELCGWGKAVRWYIYNGQDQREPVYRRVATATPR
jgi:hypothetical protein